MFVDFDLNTRGCLRFVVYLIIALLLVLTILAMILALGGRINLFGGGNGGPGPGGGNAPASVTYRGGSGTGDQFPVISARDFSGGNAPVTVAGSFSLDSTIALDTPAFSDGTETTLSYGYNLGSGGILLKFSGLEGSEGLGLNVSVGPWMATYMGHGCSWAVDVSKIKVSGHISCTDIPATNDADGTTGTINLELDFTADSPGNSGD